MDTQDRSEAGLAYQSQDPLSGHFAEIYGPQLRQQSETARSATEFFAYAPRSDRPDVAVPLFGANVRPSSCAFTKGLHVTPRVTHGPFLGRVGPLQWHVITAIYSGNGSLAHCVDGKPTIGRVRRGALIILPQGYVAEWNFTGQMECGHLLLDDEVFRTHELIAAPAVAPRLLSRVTVSDHVLFRLLETFASEYGRPTFAAHLFLAQCFELIRTQIVRRHSSLAAIRDEPASVGMAKAQQRRLIHYMEDNIRAPLSLAQLARHAGLSRNYLCTAFRQATGFTPLQYLTWLRIERAKGFLAAPGVDIKTIASNVGYQTASAFTARFRELTGMSPSAFRRQLP